MTTPARLTWHQVAAFRLARHHLAARAPRGDLTAVARDMCGAQAQLDAAARISVAIRLAGAEPADIEAALADRRLVKAACMRRTLFLVPADDVASFVRGATRRAEKEVRWALGKGVPEKVLDAAIAAALGALDEPRTRPEIAARVSRTLGVKADAIPGGGWGRRSHVAAVPVGHLTYPIVDLLHLAGARGIVLYGPPRGSEPTFVRADAWVPGFKDVTVAEAEDRLLVLYLAAYAPATPTDFALWSGMTLTGAREIWARAADRLAPVEVEGWSATALAADVDALAGASLGTPGVRLLPYFDTFLLGHRERDHLVAPEERGRVFRPQGWIAPVLLVDGRVAAVWSHAVAGNELRVRLAPFRPLTRAVGRAVAEEAADLARFLGQAAARVEVS